MDDRDFGGDSGAGGARIGRRDVLRGIGAVAGSAAVPGTAAATGENRSTPGESGSDSDGPRYALSQGDACVPLAPLRGDAPVEQLYDYRLPEKYVSDANGASDPGSGPYYSSVGTRSLQRPDASTLFLYEGPEGLSLVVVHGSVSGGDSGGGSATFSLSGVPDGASWVVKDDLYRNPKTGAIADTNYDRWDVGGGEHRVDWTWGGNGTDGGALRGLGEDFELRLDPAFNEDAALYGDHYEGEVADWYALTAAADGIKRVPLSLSEPLTLRSGACEEPLIDVEVGNASVVVRRDGLYVTVGGVTVSVTAAGVDVDTGGDRTGR